MARKQHYVERNSSAYQQNNLTNLIDHANSQMVKRFYFLEGNLMKRVTDQLHTIMRQYQTPHMFQQQQKCATRTSTTTTPATTIPTTAIPTTKLNKESQITELCKDPGDISPVLHLNSEANASENGGNNGEMSAGINNEWNREFDPDINIPDIYNFECNYVDS